MQTIRFVGGPYHGRVLAVEEKQSYIETVMLDQRLAVFGDGTLDPATPIKTKTVGYWRVWLERKTPTLQVREQVMLVEGVSPSSSEALNRWQELRAA